MRTRSSTAAAARATYLFLRRGEKWRREREERKKIRDFK